MRSKTLKIFKLMTILAMLCNLIYYITPAYANDAETLQEGASETFYKFDADTKEVTGVYQGTTIENFKNNIEKYQVSVFKNINDDTELMTGFVEEGMVVKTKNERGNVLDEYHVIQLLTNEGISFARAAPTPHDFYALTINKPIDVDGVPINQPYQCVDLFNYFNRIYHNGIYIRCGATGYAQDIFTQRGTNGVLQYFDVVAINQMKDGDWAIWGFNSPQAPYSHVAMFRKDDGNGNATFLQQNYLGKPYVTQDSISKSGIIGVLRPKIFHQTTPQPVAETFAPITGDWNGDGIDTIGLYETKTAKFYLKNRNDSSETDITFLYGNPGDIPISGDWDGDGVDSVGVYRPSTSTFYLKNSNDTGGSTYAYFKYGSVGDIPIVGDWDGDGIDTVGVYKPKLAKFYLKERNDSSDTTTSFVFGNPGYLPIVGDWTGEEKDSVGVYQPAKGMFSLKNSNNNGTLTDFVFGNTGFIPITGDWNKDGKDTIGLYSKGKVLLRNSNTSGFHDVVFEFGR